MTGETTPPTQWATCPLVTLRIGFGVVLAGGGAIAAGGDAVPDGDLPGADEDVLDEQPQHPLAFSDGGGVGVAVQLGEEAFQVVGELEVGLAAGCLCVESVDLPAQVRLPRAFPPEDETSNDAAGFASCYGPHRCSPLTGLLTLGSDPARFPTEPPACYRASWQLPGPDSHRQATTSLRTRRSTMAVRHGVTSRSAGRTNDQG